MEGDSLWIYILLKQAHPPHFCQTININPIKENSAGLRACIPGNLVFARRLLAVN